MRIPRTFQNKTPIRLSMTPMIDVVFLLIIFFLVASYFVRSEQSREVVLPEASGARRDTDESLPHVTVTVESDGTYSVGGQPLTAAQIERQLQDLAEASAADGRSSQLRIRADQQADYREIRQLIELAAAQQIRSIRFAVTAIQTN
jgi:biopolymer transport protein ExbD